MIYLVTNQQKLFKSDLYEIIGVDKCLSLLSSVPLLQVDSETTGRDSHINEVLCLQLGNDAENFRIVIDTTTIDLKIFKSILEEKFLIFQNGKFDLQFLYNYGIHPLRVYDTMIVEQFLHLGYPPGVISYSLKEIAWRRLGVDLDKTVRGEIIWRGLDDKVIEYAAKDVVYLEKIMKSQCDDLKNIKNGYIGAQIECDAVPAVAYMEWCGIMLDERKWKEKMINDKKNLEEAEKALNDFVIKTSILKDFTYVDRQGNLFTGFDLTPKVTINWSSSQQVVKVAKLLGFDTKTKDKETGIEKDTVIEDSLRRQKGINDEFLKLYLGNGNPGDKDYYAGYTGSAKVVTSFGQGHLNAINPITGRIHTIFRQIGSKSGRFSCGSNQINTDLAKYKGLPTNPSQKQRKEGKVCSYPNIQQLPSDNPTRSSFIAPKGYNFVSADFSAEESRLGADIYKDKEFLKEFKEGSGDTHSMFAWIVFRKECEECGCKSVKDVKKKAPQWRKKVKGYEFGWMFGAAAPKLAETSGSTVEEAQEVLNKLENGFTGVSSFAKRGSQFVRNHGYIVINPNTGHRLRWWDWKKWKAESDSFTSEFWDNYRKIKENYKNGFYDEIPKEMLLVRKHFQAAGTYDRLARNAVTQGTGSIIMKTALCELFKWIINNNYFGIIHICACVHDEICCDYPKKVEEFPKVLENIMEKAAAKFCKSLPIPAEAEVSDHWVH